MSIPPPSASSDPLPPGGKPSWWRAVRKRLILYGTVYLLFILAIMFAGLADRILLFPSTEAISVLSDRKLIPLGQGVLETWVQRLGPPNKPALLYVLHFNGNGSRAEAELIYFLPQWMPHEVEMWAVNYPGYGGSTPPARLAAIPPAALTAYDELAKVAAGKPIIVSGSSIGTTAALYIASQRPVSGLVLQSPPPLQNLILGRHGWWNLWLLAGPVALGVPADLNSLVTAPRVHAPAVFVLSEKDSIVPLAYQEKVVQAYGGPYQTVLLKGADHNTQITNTGAAQVSQALAWLIEQIATKP